MTQVTPQPDGSLRVESPDETTRFDMGNQALFAAFNGKGDLTRLLLTEGFDAGRWKFRLQAEDVPVPFQEARAIGRLWELHAEVDALTADFHSCLDETSAAVYQFVELNNASSKSLRITLTLDMDFRPPLSWQQQARSRLARTLPRLPCFQHLWRQGWAKVIQPESAQKISPINASRLVILGTKRWVWGASVRPVAFTVSGLQAQVRFEVDVPARESLRLDWALAQGDEDALQRALMQINDALQDARDYAHWLRACYSSDDPLLQSLFVAGLNAAVAMFKQFPDGFAGLLAGPAYAYPPRLYFRDGYWTAQVLLRFRPDLVRRHLLSLARGIRPNGACPSGVFAPHLLRAWGRPNTPLDWLPDHYDAPPYFVLLLDEYIRACSDTSILQTKIEGSTRTIWETAYQAMCYLITRDQDGDGLIEKPYQANDWADNVRRNVWVTYDQALYAAALQAGSRLAASVAQPETADRFRALATTATAALNAHLWDEARGYFVNYTRPGFSETHFSIDTLLALYYDLVEPERARRVLDAARRLQTRGNPNQPFGDWGVMCVYPLYERGADLFDITAQPYRYHNGADWPYWDGVYAAVLRRHNNPDWQYVLTRWWTYSLEQGWLTPVEYYSPPYPAGGMLQGWSGMPAAVLATLGEPVEPSVKPEPSEGAQILNVYS